MSSCNEVFVDLFTIVRQAMRVGEPNYSIKNIEHLYKEARTGDVATAMESVVNYQRWLESQDGPDWQSSKILADIRLYNKEDCDSTWLLAEWLRNVQRTSRIAWMPPVLKGASTSEEAQARDAAGELAQHLLNTRPDGEQNAEKRSLQELLAYLLEFHWREARPVFWAMFDRHQMTEEQLIDDIDCLGGLERTSRPREAIKKSWLYEYKFDPSQDTKLHASSDCFFAHDLSVKATIETFDADKGLLTIKLGPKKPEPPQRLSLIPDEFVDPKKIAQSIYRTVENWSKTAKLPAAIEDFLLRNRPRIQGNSHGPIVPANTEPLTGAINAALNLDSSTLCIQGPPGSGKTYTAAYVILTLLERNERVGVTSNSHKAICKLMSEVAKFAAKAGVALSAVEIGGDENDPVFQNTAVWHAKSAKDVFASGQSAFQLIGGTAWAFSDESAADSSARGMEFIFSKSRLNVAISRAKSLAIVVGNPAQRLSTAGAFRAHCKLENATALAGEFCISGDEIESGVREYKFRYKEPSIGLSDDRNEQLKRP